MTGESYMPRCQRLGSQFIRESLSPATPAIDEWWHASASTLTPEGKPLQSLHRIWRKGRGIGLLNIRMRSKQ